MASMLSPLAQAVLDALSDAVFVFDPEGRMVHANGAGRAMLDELGPNDGAASADRLLPRLGQRGARVETLWQSGMKLGEAVVVASGPGKAGTLAERERRAIMETLSATGWKLTESARRLGISRTTLWRRLNAYGLERPKEA